MLYKITIQHTIDIHTITIQHNNVIITQYKNQQKRIISSTNHVWQLWKTQKKTPFASDVMVNHSNNLWQHI